MGCHLELEKRWFASERESVARLVHGSRRRRLTRQRWYRRRSWWNEDEPHWRGCCCGGGCFLGRRFNIFDSPSRSDFGAACFRNADAIGRSVASLDGLDDGGIRET